MTIGAGVSKIGKIVKQVPLGKRGKTPEAIKAASEKRVAEGTKKRQATLKKQQTAKKLAKDAERKAARAAARQTKKESKQKVAVIRPGSREVMGGNKPLAKRSGSETTPYDKRMAGGKKSEKVVQGEVVSAPKVSRATPTPTSTPVTRPGYSKKKAAATAAVATSVAGTAYMASKSGDKKTPAKDSGERINIVAEAEAKRKAETPTPKAKGKLSEFGAAFKEARKKRIDSGEDMDKATFEYKGKKYHTRTKEEEAKRKSKKK